jgi:outer membrane lipoprotein SlyB
LRSLALPLVLFPGLLTLTLAGCNEGYSPNTYASNAAQEEAAVQRGMIIGVRPVTITTDGTVGAATGGAAGGLAGSQVSGAPVVTALGAIGGTLVGGIGGTAAAQAVGKTKGWEYIVQEEPGDKLVSVTQTSKTALPIGLHVLVIAGTQQARIVPDYTVQIAAAPPPAAKPAATTKTAAAPAGPTIDEIDISPALPDSGAADPSQPAPITVGNDPTTAPPPSPPATLPAPSSTSAKP